MMFSRLSIALALVLAASSCAGYRIGSHKPPSLASVQRIAVPMFRSNSLHPRAEALATSATANALVTDGTYRLASTADADAILEGTLTEVNYQPVRGSRTDTLLPEELDTRVTLNWQLRDARNPTRILANGISYGSSQIFVSSNLQTARQNSLPEAMSRAADSLVSQLANGY